MKVRVDLQEVQKYVSILNGDVAVLDQIIQECAPGGPYCWEQFARMAKAGFLDTGFLGMSAEGLAAMISLGITPDPEMGRWIDGPNNKWGGTWYCDDDNHAHFGAKVYQLFKGEKKFSSEILLRKLERIFNCCRYDKAKGRMKFPSQGRILKVIRSYCSSMN